MAPRIAFPEYLEDDTTGHWMNIVAYEGGSLNIQSTCTLFIPGGVNGSNMVWQSTHDYQEAKMTKIVMDAAKDIPIVGTAMSAFAGAAPMFGAAINPKVEVLYRSTNLRVFQFSFIMAPQSATDARQLRTIVKTLRQYSSPTLVGKSDPRQGYIGASGQASYLSTGGLFLSPSEFMIEFWYRNPLDGTLKENDNIPKIGRCVMDHIDINYNPQGEWSTFHDGMPTSAMLTMTFKEMRIIDSQNVQDGY